MVAINDPSIVDKVVRGWFDEARELILATMQEHLQVSAKAARNDLVTNVDKAVEQLYIKLIHEFDSQAQIVSEEGFGDRVQSLAGAVWFVDPIDGTMNFVKQHNEFASMLALYVDGAPVWAGILDVMQNQLIHGGPAIGVYRNGQPLPALVDEALTEGIIQLSGARLVAQQYAFPQIARQALGFRVNGSAGISFINVFLGRCVGYSSRMKPWDFAAGVALAKSLGLTVGVIDETQLDMLSSETVLVATKKAMADIQAITSVTIS